MALMRPPQQQQGGGPPADFVDGPGVGLQNLGNSCFMNAILQCLAHTKDIKGYCHRKQHSRNCHSKQLFCSACKLEHLVNRLFQRHAPSFPPKQWAHNLPLIARGFKLGRQEDAHEFLRCLLEQLTKHLLPMPSKTPPTQPQQQQQQASSARAPPPQRETVIQKWFQGSLQSSIRCLGCGAESKTVDPFLDLSLELKDDGAAGSASPTCRSVDQAMRRFTQPEYLDGDNGYKCESCGKLGRAKKQFRIASAPKVLTIHLKRFSFSANGQSGKIREHVAFDPVWDVSPFMATAAAADGQQQQQSQQQSQQQQQQSQSQQPKVTYKLCAVLVHEGHSTTSGHYYAYARTNVPQHGYSNWHVYNDSVVRRVGERDVHNACAYILLYEKEQQQQDKKNSGGGGGNNSSRSSQGGTGGGQQPPQHVVGSQGGGGGAPMIGPMIGPSPRPPPATGTGAPATGAPAPPLPATIAAPPPIPLPPVPPYHPVSTTPMDEDGRGGIGGSGSEPPKASTPQKRLRAPPEAAEADEEEAAAAQRRRPHPLESVTGVTGEQIHREGEHSADVLDALRATHLAPERERLRQAVRDSEGWRDAWASLFADLVPAAEAVVEEEAASAARAHQAIDERTKPEWRGVGKVVDQAVEGGIQGVLAKLEDALRRAKATLPPLPP